MSARCECGEWSGVACTWSGDESDLVSVDWMPEHLRASHEAAGIASIHGLGRVAGVCRLNVSEECAERILEESGDWAVRR